ncbi:MAG: FAD-dependent monooxygenase [Halieaceae bacterium]|nr:FAD-dependent monooxygenase [Halieaceae bacterium]
MNHSNKRNDYDVIVGGAGPVGLVLSIDLGRRGVRVLLLERDPTTKPYPKMDRSNARTMEIFRRLGFVDRVRALGFPPEIPMDVFIVTRLCDQPLLTLEYPSVAEYRKRIAESTDGSLPLEPYQLVAQNDLEPLLLEIAFDTPNVNIRYACELLSFNQTDTQVQVKTRSKDGSEGVHTARYLVGADGGSSTVRKQLDIALEGQGGLGKLTQVIFHSDDLFEKIPISKGRHYAFADERALAMVVQGNRREFSLHALLPPETDFAPLIRDLMGFPFSFEIKHVLPWQQNLLIAERYREQNVFLAGDAIHLLIPTGGLGMNSGVGDALDLSWKLAGTLHGWGGPALLDAYEIERRPVAERNREASGWAAAGVPEWKNLVKPHVRDDTPEGEVLRAEITEAARDNHARMHGMIGVELGYTYAGSPLIATEPGDTPAWEISSYTPHARPGVRIPHMWLQDGRALQDLLGMDYTLLDLCGDFGVGPLEQAFRERGAPLEVVRLDEPQIRDSFEASALLLRPDLHIVWRGHSPPEDPAALAGLATGHQSL